MAGLYYGAYLAACREIGLKLVVPARLGSGNGPVADLKLFRTWMTNALRDRDVGSDCRMMVPIFFDQRRRKFKVWMVLGVLNRGLSVTFDRRPRVVGVTDKSGNRLRLSKGLWSGGKGRAVEIVFKNSQAEQLFSPVFAEAYVTHLIPRKRFRSLCSRYKTKRKILGQLY